MGFSKEHLVLSDLYSGSIFNMYFFVQFIELWHLLPTFRELIQVVFHRSDGWKVTAEDKAASAASLFFTPRVSFLTKDCNGCTASTHHAEHMTCNLYALSSASPCCVPVNVYPSPTHPRWCIPMAHKLCHSCSAIICNPITDIVPLFSALHQSALVGHPRFHLSS